MANFFSLTLDTTGPSSPSIILESNSQYATQQLINAAIDTGDADTTGYQMKIWGDLDLSWAKSNGIVTAGASTVGETDALWITYTTSKQLQLSTGDSSKTIFLKIRDNVHNASAQASDNITLDLTRPIVSVTGPDVSVISKNAGKNTSNFSFSVDTDFVEYKIKVVSSQGASHDTGTLIPTTNGSTSMAATGTWTSGSVVNSSITGADLEAASAGDGSKIVKIFVKDDAGNWSI